MTLLIMDLVSLLSTAQFGLAGIFLRVNYTAFMCHVPYVKYLGSI